MNRVCFGLFFGIIVVAPTVCLADFRLCNQSAARVSVAFAYTNGTNWISEGWWNLKPGMCETILKGTLVAQFYYIYAIDERGGEWKGRAFMCTRDHEFKIEGRENCFVRGFDRTGFFEVDTGKSAKDWTVQLTDPALIPMGQPPLSTDPSPRNVPPSTKNP